MSMIEKALSLKLQTQEVSLGSDQRYFEGFDCNVSSASHSGSACLSNFSLSLKSSSCSWFYLAILNSRALNARQARQGECIAVAQT